MQNSGERSTAIKFFERQENQLESDITKFGSKFVDPATFVNFTHFPIEFNTIDDCLM